MVHRNHFVFYNERQLLLLAFYPTWASSPIGSHLEPHWPMHHSPWEVPGGHCWSRFTFGLAVRMLRSASLLCLKFPNCPGYRVGELSNRILRFMVWGQFLWNPLLLKWNHGSKEQSGMLMRAFHSRRVSLQISGGEFKEQITTLAGLAREVQGPWGQTLDQSWCSG